jgi:glutathione reductase (NADPH)
MLIKASEELGIKVRLNVPVHLIEKKEGGFVVHTGEDQAYESDIAVHGAGRVPELAGLDLEKGGVEVDRKGIVVNEYLQSISNPSVYVAGDANARGVALTPVATMEGRTVAKNILEGNNTKVDYTAVPSVVFTLPPMASVGMQEEDAEKQGLKYEKNYKDSSSWYTSRRIGLKHSGVKVLIDKENNRVLGAHLLGHNAEEIINIFALAIKANISIEVLRQMVWAYPTTCYDINYMI